MEKADVEKAIAALVSIAQSETADDSDRIRAADTILNHSDLLAMRE